MDIRRIFLSILALAYIGLGIFLLFRKIIESTAYNYALASLFLIYGSWRLYRALKNNSENSNLE
ncbi:MAG: C4-dicarboxylate ABC transporter [Saprospiraceae bacterium]